MIDAHKPFVLLRASKIVARNDTFYTKGEEEEEKKIWVSKRNETVANEMCLDKIKCISNKLFALAVLYNLLAGMSHEF